MRHVHHLEQLADFEETLIQARKRFPKPRDDASELAEILRRAKQWGYSDVQIAAAWGGSFTADDVRKIRRKLGIEPVYKLVDTCAAEFEAETPYYYSSYEQPFVVDGKVTSEDEIRLSDRPKAGRPRRLTSKEDSRLIALVR